MQKNKMAAILLLVFANTCFAENNIAKNTCTKDKLSYSLGSVIYQNSKKFVCSEIYKDELVKDSAWVMVKIPDSKKQSASMELIYLDNNKSE